MCAGRHWAVRWSAVYSKGYRAHEQEQSSQRQGGGLEVLPQAARYRFYVVTTTSPQEMNSATQPRGLNSQFQDQNDNRADELRYI